MAMEVTIVGCADDLTLIVISGKSAETISAIVTNMMVENRTWMEERRLEIAPQKTEVIIPVGRNSLKKVSLRIGRAEVTTTRSLKFLWVVLSRNM